MDEHINMLGSIKTKEDFLKFMKLFIPTIKDNSLEYYLEALTAWVDDMDGYCKNAEKPVPDDINWDFIATVLYAGSIYE